MARHARGSGDASSGGWAAAARCVASLVDTSRSWPSVSWTRRDRHGVGGRTRREPESDVSPCTRRLPTPACRRQPPAELESVLGATLRGSNPLSCAPLTCTIARCAAPVPVGAQPHVSVVVSLAHHPVTSPTRRRHESRGASPSLRLGCVGHGFSRCECCLLVRYVSLLRAGCFARPSPTNYRRWRTTRRPLSQDEHRRHLLSVNGFGELLSGERSGRR